MPSKLEELRQIIIRTNPSILDLTFGCRVKNNRRGDMGYILAQEFNSNVYYNEDIKEVRVRDFEPDEIIGRPITLADVLLAINAKFTRERYTVDCLGGFKKIGTNWIQCNWNLHKDDLTLQDESTIDFLHQLLSDKSGKEEV